MIYTRSLYVHCTFTVRSLYVHLAFAAFARVPVVEAASAVSMARVAAPAKGQGRPLGVARSGNSVIRWSGLTWIGLARDLEGSATRRSVGWVAQRARSGQCWARDCAPGAPGVQSAPGARVALRAPRAQVRNVRQLSQVRRARHARRARQARQARQQRGIEVPSLRHSSVSPRPHRFSSFSPTSLRPLIAYIDHSTFR